MTKSRALLVMAAAFFAASAGQPVPAQAPRPALQVLGQLSPGRWELRPRDGGAVQKLCLGERRNAIQLLHRDLACDWLVLEDGRASLTVQYTCRGRGYGRTHIRRETPQLIQLETQGIADGVPFEVSAEGRRVGDCAA